jgi:hypothetical protein
VVHEIVDISDAEFNFKLFQFIRDAVRYIGSVGSWNSDNEHVFFAS